ncbi:hypothetical protein [Massilia psychrophila]|nr:hypothetical protein [Massilia psychrophila]
MKISRTLRLLTAIVAIFGMLFMQLAAASYVCPGTSPENQHHAASATPMPADMAHCDGIDPAQPTLCHVHVHGESVKHSLDKTPVPDVPPFVPVVLVLDLEFFDLVAPAVARQARPPIALARTCAPPIAIRNCCFRI